MTTKPEKPIRQVVVVRERRCELCRMWLSDKSGPHGSLSDLAGGSMCQGKGKGRARWSVSVGDIISLHTPRTEREKQVGEYWLAEAKRRGETYLSVNLASFTRDRPGGRRKP